MRRNTILSLVTALAAAILLTACSGGSSSKDSGSSSDSGGTTLPASTPIMVQSYSGTARALDGTWKKCVNNVTDGHDDLHVFVYTGADFTYTTTQYTVSSGCTGTSTPLFTIAGTMTVTGTKPSLTWTDGNTTASQAPARAGGGGNLPDPVTASLVTTVISSTTDPVNVPAGTVYMMRYVDDSGTAWRLYGEKTGLPACDDSSPVGICIGNMDPDIKQ